MTVKKETEKQVALAQIKGAIRDKEYLIQKLMSEVRGLKDAAEILENVDLFKKPRTRKPSLAEALMAAG